VELYTGGAAAGTPVELIGMLHRVADDDQLVPVGVDPADVEVVLYRFVITCCVADAVPATALLEGSQTGLEEQWVRLRGRLSFTGATQDIPQLSVDSIEPVAEPANPYLFMGQPEL
jgi:hypothetical protein